MSPLLALAEAASAERWIGAELLNAGTVSGALPKVLLLGLVAFLVVMGALPAKEN